MHMVLATYVLDKTMNVASNLHVQQYTINWERFAGLNFHVFCGFQEYCEIFSGILIYIIQALLFKHFKCKSPQKFSREKLHWVESVKV